MQTPREIENWIHRNPHRPVNIERLYAARDQYVERLQTQPVVTLADLAGLDRLGRFRVAAELWGSCTQSARSALLNDTHHHVRSAATLAAAAR
jgi:hypothetical protein